MRAASLCPVVLACICVVGTAEARDDVRPSEDRSPCNDTCRAWMSWSPNQRGTAIEPPVPSAPVGSGKGPKVSHASPASPLHSPAREMRQAGLPRRKDHSAPRPSIAEAPLPAVGSQAEERPPRIGQSALVTRTAPPFPPPRPFGMEAAGDGPAQGRVANMDDAPDRLRAASEVSDAAILARPLYEAPSPAAPDATPDRPYVPASSEPSTAAAAPEVRAEPPVEALNSSSGAERQAEESKAQAAGSPMQGAEPTVRELEPASAAGISGEHPAEAEAATSTKVSPPPLPTMIVVKSPAGSRSTLSSGMSSALPASDLESLEEARAPERPDRGTLKVHPWTWTLLLGGLALLSLVGSRRPR